MEKPGKRLASRRIRRLLISALSLFALVPASLFAVDVDIFVSSFELETLRTLRIEFTVLDASPSDVSLTEIGLPESFTPVSGQKERRMKDSTPATVISREWVPTVPGNFSLGPFLVTVRDETVTIPQVYITVTEPPVPEKATLRWRVDGGDAGTGRPLRITLEGVFSGTAGAISCPAPENALLEAVPVPGIGSGSLTGTGDSPVVLASWNWTPLVPGWQDLPRATFTYTAADGNEYVIASASEGIAVSRESASGVRKTVPGSVSRAFSGPGRDSSDSDQKDRNGQENANGQVDRTDPEASGGIDGGNAETIAALRHREYTAFFSRGDRLKRLALEEKLELGETLPVPHAAWKPFSVIGAVLVFSLAFVLRIAGFRSRLVKHVSVALFFCSALLVILAVSVYTRDPGPAGVLKGCDLFHVPEPGSSVVDSLPEGTAVIIGRRAGDWVYVRTVSDLDGWVPSDAIIEYTAENVR